MHTHLQLLCLPDECALYQCTILLCLHFACNIFSYPFIFNLSGLLQSIFYSAYINLTCLSTLTISVLQLVYVVPFIFNVIINMFGFKVYHYVICLVFVLFLICFSLAKWVCPFYALYYLFSLTSSVSYLKNVFLSDGCRIKVMHP